jgi:amino acid transporter
VGRVTSPPQSKEQPELGRSIALPGALALNVMNMVGVGPFITLPLVLAAMGGPQAAAGWLLGAAIAVCDGLVWAELGAAMPRAGGSYVFLREIYRGDPARFDLGRFLGFLYIWQLSFTAPLSIASGCLGFAQYAAYLWPALNGRVVAGFAMPRWTSLLAAATCVAVVGLLYRGLGAITRVAGVLTVGVFATFAAILTAGFTHLQPALLQIPAGAFHPSHAFFLGLGSATLIATYDYWGYYNVCFLGGEVQNPGRTIPAAVLLSIALVATLYLLMQFAVVGAVPWRELVHGSAPQAAAALLLDRVWGHGAAVAISLLVMWTAFSSVTALLLGYSRAPYAAAVDGNYFAPFARLHPRHGFPHVSMLALGAMAVLFCFLPLARVISALVAVRIVLQYILQQVGVMVLRRRQPGLARPFRIWFYPLPPLLALAGFLFLLLSRQGAGRELLFAALVAVTGTALFLVRERRLSRARAAQS